MPVPLNQRPLSALPAPAVRAVAFVAILLGGLAGGVIGWVFVILQTTGGGHEVAASIGAAIGAVTAAIGTAVVTVLAMRALGVWRPDDTNPARPNRSRSAG